MRLSFIASATLVALPLTAQFPTIAARADSMLRDAERRGFSGSVLITIDGRPALLKGYGLAERATARRFTPATVVQIGSNTKDFTTVAILQLVDAGKLSLDDSLPSIWQGVPADKRGITVRMLLTHRAGFAGHADPIAGDFAPVTRPQMVDRALARGLAFRPGTREQYSNEGYSLLAAIIELRSGESFDQYVQHRILAPIGLTRTGFHLPGFAASDLAHGYTRDGRDNGTMLARPHASDGPFWNLRGNGGMLSTLEEMQRFYTALYGDKLVRRALREEFFPDQPTALAGSDNVSFFVFAHEPELKLDLLLASTNAAVPGPSVFRPLIQMITGRRGPDGEDAPPATARAVSRLADLPDTPAARAAAQWLTAYNSADSSAIRSVLAAMAPNPNDPRSLDVRLAATRTRRAQGGALELLGIVADAPHLITLRVRNGNGDTVDWTFEVEPRAPFRLTTLRALIVE